MLGQFGSSFGPGGATQLYQGRSPLNLYYRPLQLADHEALKAIHRDLFPIDYEEVFFRKAVGSEDRVFSWAAVHSEFGRDHLVGFVTARLVYMYECDPVDRQVMGLNLKSLDGHAAVYVLTLGVVSSCRQCGIARNLLRLVHQHAARLRCTAIFLHVISYNDAAMRLYGSSGYQPMARLPNFYHLVTGRQPNPDQAWYDAFLYAAFMNGMGPEPSPALQWAGGVLGAAVAPFRSMLGTFNGCMPNWLCGQGYTTFVQPPPPPPPPRSASKSSLTDTATSSWQQPAPPPQPQPPAYPASPDPQHHSQLLQQQQQQQHRTAGGVILGATAAMFLQQQLSAPDGCGGGEVGRFDRVSATGGETGGGARGQPSLSSLPLLHPGEFDGSGGESLGTASGVTLVPEVASLPLSVSALPNQSMKPPSPLEQATRSPGLPHHHQQQHSHYGAGAGSGGNGGLVSPHYLVQGGGAGHNHHHHNHHHHHQQQQQHQHQGLGVHLASTSSSSSAGNHSPGDRGQKQQAHSRWGEHVRGGIQQRMPHGLGGSGLQQQQQQQYPQQVQPQEPLQQQQQYAPQGGNGSLLLTLFRPPAAEPHPHSR